MARGGAGWGGTRRLVASGTLYNCHCLILLAVGSMGILSSSR